MNYYYEWVKYDKNIPGRILMQDKPGWRCNTTPHWHPELEFVYMLEGSLQVCIDGTVQTIQSGDFYFCNAKVIHSTATPDSTAHYKYIVLQLSHDFLLRFHDDCIFRIRPDTAYDRLKIELQHLVDLSELDTAQYSYNFTDIEKNKVLLEICQILLEDCIFSSTNILKGTDFTGYARNVMEYVCKHYNQKLSLQSLAELVGLSPQYLSKYFRKATNMCLTHYINLIRLEHSNQCLLNQNMNISDVALSNGFPDVKTYVRTCKSVYGMTPSALRKEIWNTPIEQVR
ncbi:MAG: AraC family transcriptional regulator [Lachnospiraceae bacterium]|nr:AraC family transcriptional regulator [Lachnospiraceae bacterium]